MDPGYEFVVPELTDAVEANRNEQLIAVAHGERPEGGEIVVAEEPAAGEQGASDD